MKFEQNNHGRLVRHGNPVKKLIIERDTVLLTTRNLALKVCYGTVTGYFNKGQVGIISEDGTKLRFQTDCRDMQRGDITLYYVFERDGVIYRKTLNLRNAIIGFFREGSKTNPVCFNGEPVSYRQEGSEVILTQNGIDIVFYYKGDDMRKEPTEEAEEPIDLADLFDDITTLDLSSVKDSCATTKEKIWEAIEERLSHRIRRNQIDIIDIGNCEIELVAKPDSVLYYGCVQITLFLSKHYRADRYITGNMETVGNCYGTYILCGLATYVGNDGDSAVAVMDEHHIRVACSREGGVPYGKGWLFATIRNYDVTYFASIHEALSHAISLPRICDTQSWKKLGRQQARQIYLAETIGAKLKIYPSDSSNISEFTADIDWKKDGTEWLLVYFDNGRWEPIVDDDMNYFESNRRDDDYRRRDDDGRWEDDRSENTLALRRYARRR